MHRSRPEALSQVASQAKKDKPKPRKPEPFAPVYAMAGCGWLTSSRTSGRFHPNNAPPLSWDTFAAKTRHTTSRPLACRSPASLLAAAVMKELTQDPASGSTSA